MKGDTQTGEKVHSLHVCVHVCMCVHLCTDLFKMLQFVDDKNRFNAVSYVQSFLVFL